MAIVRALPGVESMFVVQASYILLKKSRGEMFLTFKDLESQLEWLQGMIYNQKKSPTLYGINYVVLTLN